MLEAGGNTKADKVAATEALKGVRTIVDIRAANDVKPEVVEHTGRKAKEKGPLTIRCSNAAQCIFLADCLQEAYAAQCTADAKKIGPVDTPMPDAE